MSNLKFIKVNKEKIGDLMIEKNQEQTSKKKAVNRNDIRKQAAILAELLASSNEYLQYIEAKKNLAADEEQLFVLSELRQQQFNLRFAAMIGEDIGAEKADFEIAYAALASDPRVCDYLYAEGRFFRLIADVQEVFGSRIDAWGELFAYDDGNTLLN